MELTPEHIISNLENPLFPVLFYEQDFIKLHILDFLKNEEENEPNDKIPINNLKLDFFVKDINLKTKYFEIKGEPVMDLKDYLYSEFIDIIKKLALKNKLKNNGDESAIISKNKNDIFGKIANSMYIILTKGKLGFCNYLIFNEKTYDFMSKNKIIDKLSMTTVKTFINRKLPDNEIILGKKNHLDQPGVSLIINKNSIEKIKEGNKTYMKLSYNFSKNGFSPENQYFLVNILD